MNIRCSVCNGTGLEKRESERCPCAYTFCYKCENNEGFIIKPYEECRKCYGSGTLTVDKPSNDINKPSNDTNKPSNDINKPPNDTNKPSNDINKPPNNLNKDKSNSDTKI